MRNEARHTSCGSFCHFVASNVEYSLGYPGCGPQSIRGNPCVANSSPMGNRNRDRNRNRNGNRIHNFSKVGTGNGKVKNSFGSTALSVWYVVRRLQSVTFTFLMFMLLNCYILKQCMYFVTFFYHMTFTL